MRILQSDQYWRDGSSKPLDIVDVNALLYLMIGITRQYQSLLRASGTVPNFYFKARLLHLSRHVPFVDSPTILGGFQTYGIPILLNDRVTVPSGTDPDSFVFLGSEDSGATDGPIGVDQAATMFVYLLTAFGIGGLGTASDAAGELLAAASRAVKNQGAQ